MTTGAMVRTTNSGRMAITCGCGVTEKVKPTYAARRKIFCGNCHTVLRRPPEKKATEPTRRAERELGPNAVRTGRIVRGRGARTRPTRSRGPASRDERPASFQRMPNFERHVVAIGVWYRLGGLLGMLAGIALTALVGPLALVSVGIAAAFLVLGHGLTRYNPICRWLLVGLASLGILTTLYGGATGATGLLDAITQLGWNGAVIGILLSSGAQRIFSPEFRAIVERSREVRVAWWTSPVFFVPAALICLSLLAVAVVFLLAI